MRNKWLVAITSLVLILGLLLGGTACPAPVPPEEIPTPPALPAVEKIVIGHPVTISGKYAKAGEQAFGGIKAIVKWVNEVYGGVEIAGAKVPLEYKYYDSESKKESVTSLIERLVEVDKVDFIMASFPQLSIRNQAWDTRRLLSWLQQAKR